MKISTKAVAITVVFAVVSFALSPLLWHPNPTSPLPTAAQLPFFILLSLAESIVFGLGIAFIVFGWPLASKANTKLAKAAFVSIAWLLVSWWPHDNLHMANGLDYDGLLQIEYGFHFTLMVSSVILAFFFLNALGEKK